MEEEEYYIKGICTECGSEQPAKHIEKGAFADPPCKYCGGVVNIIAWTADARAFKNRKDNERGIGTTYDKVAKDIKGRTSRDEDDD